MARRKTLEQLFDEQYRQLTKLTRAVRALSKAMKAVRRKADVSAKPKPRPRQTRFISTEE